MKLNLVECTLIYSDKIPKQDTVLGNISDMLLSAWLVCGGGHNEKKFKSTILHLELLITTYLL